MTRLQDCRGPVRLSRRHALEVGSAGLLNLTLPHLLRAERARGGQRAHADACIVIFLNGGPSHLDMWDMKPAAPAEVRGEFKPIATTVPNLQVSEHLPKLARHMHRTTLIRSVHHSVNNAHAAAVYAALTGHDRGEIGGGARPTDYPALGSVLALRRPPEKTIVPFVSLPYITQEGRGGPPQPGFFGGWLGRSYDPLFVLRDPNAANFDMPELSPEVSGGTRKLEQRKQLLARLDSGYGSAPERELDAFRAKAFELLTTAGTREAFRIGSEPPALRDAYGRNIYGQSVLLARRLIEAGSRLVSISWAPDANATWDTHGNNFGKLKGELLPQFDAALSTLLGDLADRGLLERTLVVVMGEFGRSPKINNNAGRDHWNFCYSLLLAGGGIKAGHVHGASDRMGGQPSEAPVTPADVVATIYDCLGISSELELHDRLDRPYVLVPWGQPIREVRV